VLAQDVCSLFREQRIGDDRNIHEIWHGQLPSKSAVALGDAF
jgi:hypothetical protein